MEQFLVKHADVVIDCLSGFDRLVFRGTLRTLCHRFGVKNYLWAMQVLLKDFASHAEALTGQLREASEALARRIARPIRYLPSSATNKERIAPPPTGTVQRLSLFAKFAVMFGDVLKDQPSPKR